MRRRDGEYAIELNRAPLTWDVERGRLTFFGLPAAIFWLNPSLLTTLQPLVKELTVPLFRLLIAEEASLASEADYETIITTLGETFEEGFQAWGRAMASAGWGRFDLILYDEVDQRAVVVVRNPWELQMQIGLSKRWGCPYLKGVITGLFCRAFGVNCWAEEIETRAEEGASTVEFHVYASDKTIPGEIENVRKMQREQGHRRFERRTRELRESEARHRSIMESLDDVVFAMNTEGRIIHYHVPSDQIPFHAQRDDVLGLHLSEALPPEISMAFVAGLEQVLADTLPLTIDYTRSAGGVTKFISTRMTAMRDENGEIIGVTAVERDITEQKNRERAQGLDLAMASPVSLIEVLDGIFLLVPAASIDPACATEVLEQLHEMNAEHKLRWLILDFEGGASLDARSAEALAQVIRAVAELKGVCALAGAKAGIFESLAPFDIGAEQARSYESVKAAVAAGMTL